MAEALWQPDSPRSTDAKISEDWQVIGSEQRRAAAVQFGVFQFEPFVKINVIEMHEGQHARIGSLSIQAQSYVPVPKMPVQQSSDQPASPFVEITEHYPRPWNIGVAED